MAMAIEPGDVLARTGVLFGYDVLSAFIGEPFNHSGLAVSSFEVHHVESNGYETIAIDRFFACDAAKGGAVVRFVGPLAGRIRQRAAAIAQGKRYARIPGNPFSSSNDSRTTNCNEFVYSLFRAAIAELLKETEIDDPTAFAILSTAYAKEVLIKARQIRMRGPSPVPSLAAAGAEKMGRTQVKHPDVRVSYEGVIQCLVGPQWRCLVEEAVLDTYTPNSFIYSPFFQVVDRRECRQ